MLPLDAPRRRHHHHHHLFTPLC